MSRNTGRDNNENDADKRCTERHVKIRDIERKKTRRETRRVVNVNSGNVNEPNTNANCIIIICKHSSIVETDGQWNCNRFYLSKVAHVWSLKTFIQRVHKHGLYFWKYKTVFSNSSATERLVVWYLYLLYANEYVIMRAVCHNENWTSTN